MGKPLPMALRERVAAFVDEGHGDREAARHFRVSPRFVNELMKLREGEITHTPEWREAIETLVLLMAPSTPYVAEELWERLGNPYSVHQQGWPAYDPALTVANEVEVVVQVNGKLRDRLMLPVDLNEEAARAAALALPKIAEAVAGREPRKVIYVPGRLVNIVV